MTGRGGGYRELPYRENVFKEEPFYCGRGRG